MKSISTLLLLLLMQGLFGAQLINTSDATVVPLANNQTVVVPLSSNDPNRLFVTGDKITEANCLAGFCNVRFDQSGSVYLTLTEAAKASTGFSVFIATEGDKHFTVVGLPTLSVGKTVQFTVAGGARHKKKESSKNASYHTMLIDLIRAMINHQQDGSVTDDLSVSELPLNHTIPARPGLVIQPMKLFTGGSFQGMVYHVQNHTDKPMTLTTSQFYQRDMVAGALSHPSLKPTEIGYFYGVMQTSEADDV